MYTKGSAVSFPCTNGSRCLLKYSYTIQWVPYVNEEPTMATPKPRNRFEFFAIFTAPFPAWRRLIDKNERSKTNVFIESSGNRAKSDVGPAPIPAIKFTTPLVQRWGLSTQINPTKFVVIELWFLLFHFVRRSRIVLFYSFDSTIMHHFWKSIITEHLSSHDCMRRLK